MDSWIVLDRWKDRQINGGITGMIGVKETTLGRERGSKIKRKRENETDTSEREKRVRTREIERERERERKKREIERGWNDGNIIKDIDRKRE